ncbi:MAG: nucleoside:proton symporter [Deltaproteobacteria bacterium]|nr:nucleoside:proton symporter [Deltaproteobacteria bacterium]
MIYLQASLGLAAFCGMAWLLSENRRAVRPLPIVAGIGVQLVLALVLLKVPWVQGFFLLLNNGVAVLERATLAGTGFVFGYLGGGPLPFAETLPGATFILAFRALPLVLVVSALSALLFHWKVLPWVVRGFALALKKSLNMGGALGFGTASTVFLGMVEAPLLIKPYLSRMTRGELFVLMTVGMASIAGTVMVLYASILTPVLPNALGEILTASLLSVPAAVVIGRILVPDNSPHTEADKPLPRLDNSAMEAVARGTAEGLTLLLGIIAMLVVMVALVALVNEGLAVLPMVDGLPLTLQRMLGWVMAPLVWLAGIPWAEAPTAGALMGTKTVLNELLAYLDMARLPPEALSPKSRQIMVYALCGFANPGSLGILIAGLGAMAPERRGEIVSMGWRAVAGGTLATLMTGAVVALM